MPIPYKVASPRHSSASQGGDLFTEKYDLLLQWSLRLTDGERDRAEDLLHEAYVQFTLREMDFAAVENIDGYLYSVLKHLHFSHLRRARRDPLNQISPVEFDSVDLALRSTYDIDLVEVQNDLRRICSFLCWRKANAKSASYLILRFFHGYYPEEIVRIGLTSRSVVDQGIRLASSEAKMFLDSPARLRFMPGGGSEKQKGDSRPTALDSAPSFVPILFTVPAAELLQTLNEIIVANRVGACLPEETLIRYYERSSDLERPVGEEGVASIERALLAHLVSCPPCLDTVNRSLQIPPLSDRFPGERLGRYRRGVGEGVIRRVPQGTGSKMRHQQAFHEMQAAKHSILKIAQARARACFEHQPKKLFVAVNGEIVAAQDVASDHSKQSIRLHRDCSVDFIEVFSEQGIRLALIGAIDMLPETKDVLWQTVSLSAGRSLKTILTFSPSGPLLEVAYDDLLLAHSVCFLEEELEHSLELIADLESSRNGSSGVREGGVKALLETFRRCMEAWLDQFRPVFLSGAIIMLFAFIVILYGLHLRRTPPSGEAQGARALLAEALQQEGVAIAKGHLIHRMFTLEISDEDGKNAQRDSVDLWESAITGQRALRLSSSSGKLQAGVWKAADGSYTVYKGNALTSHTTAPRNLRDVVAAGDSESLWMYEPSATSFEQVAGDQGTMAVGRTSEDFVIEYRPAAQAERVVSPHLVYETLTLRPDHHVVGQVLWIESAGRIRRYSYREVSYEDRKATSSDANDFTPDASLMPPHASAGYNPSVSQDKRVFLAHLQLEAFLLLNSVNADSGEQISVRRMPYQRLSIHGVLPSAKRLVEVKRALAPLLQNPLVDISLISADQLQQAPAVFHHEAGTSSLMVESYEINAQSIPAQARLNAYFSRRGHAGKDLDRQIDSFCQETLDHSSRALQQAWTLHTLASSFSIDDWQHVSLNDRKQWIALYLRHSTVLQVETQAISQSLSVLLTGGMTEPNPPEAVLRSPAAQGSLNTLSDQLLEQSSVADRVLRAALTASAPPSQDLDALCQQLQLSFTNTDRVIREIEHRAQDLELSRVFR